MIKLNRFHGDIRWRRCLAHVRVDAMGNDVGGGMGGLGNTDRWMLGSMDFDRRKDSHPWRSHSLRDLSYPSFHHGLVDPFPYGGDGKENFANQYCGVMVIIWMPCYNRISNKCSHPAEPDSSWLFIRKGVDHEMVEQTLSIVLQFLMVLFTFGGLIVSLAQRKNNSPLVRRSAWRMVPLVGWTRSEGSPYYVVVDARNICDLFSIRGCVPLEGFFSFSFLSNIPHIPRFVNAPLRKVPFIKGVQKVPFMV